MTTQQARAKFLRAVGVVRSTLRVRKDHHSNCKSRATGDEDKCDCYARLHLDCHKALDEMMEMFEVGR